MTISRSSAFSINALLIFYMNNLNGALFFNTNSFSVLSSLFAAAAKISIAPFSKIHGLLYSHKSYLNIGVLNLIFLLIEY